MDISWVTNPYLYNLDIDSLLNPLKEYITSIYINNIYGDVFKYTIHFLKDNFKEDSKILSDFIDKVGGIKFIPLVYFIKVSSDMDKILVYNITNILKEVVSSLYNTPVDYVTISYAQSSNFEYAYFIPMFSLNMIYVSKEMYLKLDDSINVRDYYSKWILPRDNLSLFALSKYYTKEDVQITRLKMSGNVLHLTNIKVDRLEFYIKSLKANGYFSLKTSSYKYRDIYIELGSLWGEIQLITNDYIIIKDDNDYGVSKEIWYKQAAEDILNGSIPKVMIHLNVVDINEDKLVILSYICRLLYEDLSMKYQLLIPYINEVSTVNLNGNFTIRIYDKNLYKQYIEMVSDMDIDHILSTYLIVKKTEDDNIDADIFVYEDSTYYIINKNNLSITSSTSTIQTSSTTYVDLPMRESPPKIFPKVTTTELPESYISINEHMNYYTINIEIPIDDLFGKNISDYLPNLKASYLLTIWLNDISLDDYPTESKVLYLTNNKEEAIKAYESFKSIELSNWGSYIYNNYGKISRTIFIN